jgi:hypothetical protein
MSLPLATSPPSSTKAAHLAAIAAIEREEALIRDKILEKQRERETLQTILNNLTSLSKPTNGVAPKR